MNNATGVYSTLIGGSVSGSGTFSVLNTSLNSGLVFNDGTNVISLADIVSRLDQIEKRLAVLNPNKELEEQFPALKQAYDEYKLVERLVSDGK